MFDYYFHFFLFVLFGVLAIALGVLLTFILWVLLGDKND